jgi:hypothetical protein
MSPPGPSEREIQDAVRREFEYHYFFRNPNVFFGGGHEQPDMLAVSFLEDLEIHGVEIKRSRQDWLHELRNPKSGKVRALCDFWSIVALPEVAKRDDIPLGSGWGLYVVRGTRFPRLECETRPTRLMPDSAFNRSLAARLLHGVLSEVPKEKMTEQAYDKGYRDAVRDLVGFEQHGVDANHLKISLEAISGGVVTRMTDYLASLRKQAFQILGAIDDALGGLSKKPEVPPPGDLEKRRAQVVDEMLKQPILAEIAERRPEEFERLIEMRIAGTWFWP